MKRTIFELALVFSIFFISCSDRSASFEDQGVWIKLKNGEDCDGYLRKDNDIYGLNLPDKNDYHYFDPLTDVDITTFEVCKGSGGYAKDKNRVYYPIVVTCEDAYEYSGCYFEEYVIEGADPVTFKYLGDGYAVDKNNMYRYGEMIPWRSIETELSKQ
jgi:hypothetical protein